MLRFYSLRMFDKILFAGVKGEKYRRTSHNSLKEICKFKRD